MKIEHRTMRVGGKSMMRIVALLSTDEYDALSENSTERLTKFQRYDNGLMRTTVDGTTFTLRAVCRGGWYLTFKKNSKTYVRTDVGWVRTKNGALQKWPKDELGNPVDFVYAQRGFPNGDDRPVIQSHVFCSGRGRLW